MVRCDLGMRYALAHEVWPRGGAGKSSLFRLHEKKVNVTSMLLSETCHLSCLPTMARATLIQS